jgi:hypothetical protein
VRQSTESSIDDLIESNDESDNEFNTRSANSLMDIEAFMNALVGFQHPVVAMFLIANYARFHCLLATKHFKTQHGLGCALRTCVQPS